MITMENSSSSRSSVTDDESSLERFEKDMDFLLCDTQSESNGKEHLDINVHRSGSAPPTVEESEAESLLGNLDFADAIGLPSENDFLSPPPSYFPQYHNGEQHNPMLSQAVPFNEDWRAVSEGRRSSLFSMQSVASVREMGREMRMGKQQNLWEQGIDGLTSPAAVVGLGPRSKSFSDALQDELKQPTVLPPHLSLAKRYNATYGSVYDHMGASDEQLRPQVLRRSSSHCFPPPGAMVNVPSGGVSSCMASYDDVAIALSSLKLAKTRSFGGENRGDGLLHQEFSGQPEHKISIPGNQNSLLQKTNNSHEIGSLSNPIPPIVGYQDFSHKNGRLSARNISNLSANGQGQLLKCSFPTDRYTMAPSVGRARYKDSGSLYNGSELPNIDFCGSNNLTINRRLIDMANNQLDAAAIVGGGTVGEYPGRRGKTGHAFQGSLVDPVYSQYLQRSDFTGRSSHMNHPSSVRNYTHGSVDMPTSQRTLVRALLAQQELQYGIQHLGRSTRLDHGYCGGTSYGLGLPYPTSRPSSSILPSSSSGSALRHSEHLPRFPSLVKNSTVGSSGLWTPENHIDEVAFGSSVLEEFKHNKTQKFELAEIIGHVAEFSLDQYGSRFIQQKLETASVEEKSVIFPEILPHARDLMTDVFGNYVIQKLFEYGTENQRKQLADQLAGHVLPLSLHMYGCRVIQKALEVVDVDQQTEMISELDGSVIRCVRDQNGNHVIQKCIECVPQEKIMFIISTFYGQVVTLSSHPYGCRIIQRVLEHCDDVKTQNIVMDEILKSVSTLALDQYGNYVIQHVLQHGKPDERTVIISTLAGQVVKMSLQKFASNVVEKCLTYGSSEERQLLINEMLGSTEENEPLQEMMRDQFGNYVVQKVLEICDDHDRELILSRIKIHLNALKRYTYGKHIVTRVEKLITTGERCTGVSSHSS